MEPVALRAARVCEDVAGSAIAATLELAASLATHADPLALDIEPNTDYRLTHRASLDRDDVPWLYSMWEGKALWWFVQWPVIGHGHAHTGEAISIRNRMGLSPF